MRRCVAEPCSPRARDRVALQEHSGGLLRSHPQAHDQELQVRCPSPGPAAGSPARAGTGLHSPGMRLSGECQQSTGHSAWGGSTSWKMRTWCRSSRSEDRARRRPGSWLGTAAFHFPGCLEAVPPCLRPLFALCSAVTMLASFMMAFDAFSL